VTKCALIGPIAVAAAFALAPAPASSDDAPHKPKPKLELLTETQRAALRHESIRVGVESRRGDEARAEAGLVVEGYPDDFHFRLGPERKRLRDGEATIRLKLSARQHEVLAFAAQACMGTTVNVEAKAAGKTAKLSAHLRKDC